MKPQIILLLFCLVLATPYASFCETTNSGPSLFGITVNKDEAEAEVQYRKGTAFFSGNGEEKDLSKAIKCFTRAAELGHTEAQYNLGLCYLSGEGAEQSDQEAEKWLQKAADQDVKEALYPLGVCYYNLEQYTEAYAWALVADSAGDSRLKDMLEPMYSEEEIAAGKARFEELKKPAVKKSGKPQ